MIIVIIWELRVIGSEASNSDTDCDTLCEMSVDTASQADRPLITLLELRGWWLTAPPLPPSRRDRRPYLLIDFVRCTRRLAPTDM